MSETIRNIQDVRVPFDKGQESPFQDFQNTPVTPAHHHAASISSLPIEVLSDIFVLARTSFKPFEDTNVTRGWLNVAGVCHYWREIALNEPRMWSRLDISQIGNLDWAETIVARSRNAPLTVNCICPRPFMDGAVLMLALMHLDRIQDLELSLEMSRYPRIEELLATPGIACLLQSLHLCSLDSPYSTGNQGIHGFLNAVQMPHLHTLDIRFFALPPSVCMVPQLRRLSYMPPGGKTTMSTVLSFLRCTPSLEQLEISGTLQVGTMECPKVELQRLSFITLATMQFDNSALFRFINYPPSLRMQFISHSPLATSDLVISDLAPVLTGSELGSHIETLSFSATKDKRFSVLATGREGPLLEMSLFRMEGESLPLVKFSALLPYSSAHTLSIRGFPSVVWEDWAALFGRHEQVQELTAEQVDSNFVRALSEPLQAGRPPFMQLRRLNLTGCNVNQTFVILQQILEGRRILGSPVDVLVLLDCGVTRDVVNHLRRYVDVEWDGCTVDDVLEEEASRYVAYLSTTSDPTEG